MSFKSLNFSKPSHSSLLITLLLLLGIGLRFYGLDRTLGSGWQGFDVNLILRYYAYAPLEFITSSYIKEFSHHVFHTILLRLMVVLFGEENEIAIRFPVFVFGIACLWSTYKVALKIFGSLSVARISLLLTALLPLHIIWSQTARGYSLTMFFSITIIFCAIRLLESENSVKWGFLFVLCGFLSVYTLQTELYFFFGLGVWIAWVLYSKNPGEEFSFSSVSRKWKGKVFLLSFSLIGIFSLLAYSPLIEQTIEVAKSEQNFINVHFYGDTRFGLVGGLIPDILLMVFQGHLKWFLAFLIVGIIWGGVVRKSYRWLPVLIFFLPFLSTLVTGIGGYPRNYLFNLPLCVIFLSGGIVRSGEYLGRKLTLPNSGNTFTAGAVVVYVLISLKILIFEYYPSLQAPSGKLYKQRLQKNSGPLDLIVIPEVTDFLYARSVLLHNLKNILLLNKLSGIKAIADSVESIDSYTVPDVVRNVPVFKGMFEKNELGHQQLTGTKKLYTLTSSNAVSLLPEDYEFTADWKVLSGRGSISLERDRGMAGKYALLLEAGSTAENQPAPFNILGNIPQKVVVGKPSFLVLVVAGSNIKSGAYAIQAVPGGAMHGGRGVLPSIISKDPANNGIRQFRMGKINTGTHLVISGKSLRRGPRDWNIALFVVRISPGIYDISLHLGAEPGESVLFDGLRLFQIETA